MIEATSSATPISGLSVGGSNATILNISHLLFADDTIIFCDRDCEQMISLRFVLTWFEAVSSLRLGQELYFGYGTGGEHIQLLVGVLGCNFNSFPTTYLGLPLGVRFKDKAIWDPIIERFEKKTFRMEIQIPF